MKIIVFILNLPWTLAGLIIAVIALPRKLSTHHHPLVFIFYVRSFWFASWMPGMKGIRGMTQGNVVLLSEDKPTAVLDHELVHIRQFEKAPLILPVLYLIESIRHGYRNNKYEVEAYSTTDFKYQERIPRRLLTK